MISSRFKRFSTLVSIAARVGYAKLSGREVSSAQLLSQIFELGGVYVKFLQVLAVRNINLLGLSENGIEAINQIYDQVPLENIDVRSALITELGARANALQNLETRPFASGSFGQVYRAMLGGEVVVVKVLRPSLVKNLKFDLRLLGLFARTASIFNRSAYDIRKIYRDFAEVTKRETDYSLEAQYADLLYKKYEQHAAIVIPKTFSEFSTKHIIVQKFIDGLAVTDLLALKAGGVDAQKYVAERLGSDLNQQLITLGQDQLASMLKEGHAHGDPHPGNIILLSGNRLALLDFGIRSRVPKDRKAFFELIKEYQKIYAGQFDFESYTLAMMHLFVSELYDAMCAFDTYTRGYASQNLLHAIKEAANDLYLGSSRDISEMISSQKHLLIFAQVINRSNRFGLKFETDEPEFLRATIMYMNLVESLGSKQVVLNAVYTLVVNEFWNYDFPSKNVQTSPERAVEVVSSWLDEISVRDVYLYGLLVSKLNRRLLNV